MVTFTAGASSFKLRGKAEHCTWAKIFQVYSGLARQAELTDHNRKQVHVEDFDPEWGIDLVSHPTRSFWVRREGINMRGDQLIGYLLAEHEWMAEQHPDKLVQPGDVVLDCGAHVGVFTAIALQRGASKVVAVEPDPTQLECLRRNFRNEIAMGKVVVVAKAVWSQEGSMMLSVGRDNSGMSSLVKERGGQQIEVPVTTIDRLVQELSLPRVDYMKLDIEGAEREALRGAMETLRLYRPRLMIDSYHRVDDLEVLPRILLSAHPDYEQVYGSCEPSAEFKGHLIPHNSFWF